MVETSDVYSGGSWISNPTGDLTFRTYVDVSTGLKDMNTGSDFVVYPNPSGGKFLISSNKKEYSIEIYNSLGKQVFSTSVKQQTSKEIDFSDSARGIYFIKIYDGEEIYIRKIVVQ